MPIDVLSCVAITCIVVHSEIFRPFRELVSKIHNTIGYWISCPMCFGFWVGLSYAIAFGLMPFQLGLLTSLSSWAIYNIVTAFGALGDYYTTVLQNGENEDE
jgi:hypothetical protein